MSTYVKAWAMLVLLAGSFLLILLSWLMSRWQGDAYHALMFASIAAFIAIGLLCLKFPQCPNCGTAVNMPETLGSGSGFWFHPERPSKECGYCGQDLT